MKKIKIKQEITKWVAAFMVIVFAASTPKLKAQAREAGDLNEETTNIVTEYSYQVQPITTMTDCEIVLAFTGSGLEMNFSTSSFKESTVIGVKDIKVQQKMWYGWKTVFTSNGAENYNTHVFMCELTYPEAVDGKTYRVTCVHYADYNGYEEAENDTGAFKFVY